MYIPMYILVHIFQTENYSFNHSRLEHSHYLIFSFSIFRFLYLCVCMQQHKKCHINVRFHMNYLCHFTSLQIHEHSPRTTAVFLHQFNSQMFVSQLLCCGYYFYTLHDCVVNICLKLVTCLVKFFNEVRGYNREEKKEKKNNFNALSLYNIILNFVASSFQVIYLFIII